MEHTVRIPTPALQAAANVLGAFHPSSGEARGVPTRFHRVDDVVYLDVASGVGNRAATRIAVEPDGFTGIGRAVHLHHEPFADLIAKMPGAHVSLTWNEDAKFLITGVIIQSGKFEAQMKERDGDPLVSVEAVRAFGCEATAVAKATLPADRLLPLLDVYAFANALAGSGGQGGVRFHRHADSLATIGTNGFAMAHVSVPVPDADIAWPMDTPLLTVPRHAIGILRARVAALAPTTRVQIWHTRTHLALTTEAWHAEVRAMDPQAQFPAWESVLRTMATAPHQGEVVLDADAVAGVVKRVTAVADSGAAVRLHVGEFARGLGVALPVSLVSDDPKAGFTSDQVPVLESSNVHAADDADGVSAYNGTVLANAAERLFLHQRVRALTRVNGAIYLASTAPTHSTQFVLAPVQKPQ